MKRLGWLAISVFCVASCGGCSSVGRAQENHFAVVRLASGEVKTIQFDIVNGNAIFEGDIVLGPADALEKSFRDSQAGQDKNRAAIVINGPQFRWPGFVIPFSFDPSLDSQQRADITSAVDVWNALIAARGLGRNAWVPRTTQGDYVTFKAQSSGDCESPVGRRGGQQFISLLTSGCDRGRIEHEMGHAMGLWHEQSRTDRDSYVRINFANIIPGKEHNFDQHVWDGGVVGRYDYGSIMHYGAYDFARNPNLPTIESPQPIGQRNAPSATDVDGVWVNHERAGWGVRICDGTRANVIRFDIGYVDNGTRRSRFWFRWAPGLRRDFEVPPDLLFKSTLWIRGEGEPHAQINMCVVYNQDPKQGMTFDADEDKEVNQGEHTNDCRCH